MDIHKANDGGLLYTNPEYQKYITQQSILAMNNTSSEQEDIKKLRRELEEIDASADYEAYFVPIDKESIEDERLDTKVKMAMIIDTALRNKLINSQNTEGLKMIEIFEDTYFSILDSKLHGRTHPSFDIDFPLHFNDYTLALEFQLILKRGGLDAVMEEINNLVIKEDSNT